MNVLAWLTFIGLIVKAGAYIVSYGVSVGNPVAAKNLYMGFNLYNLRQADFWRYTATVALIVAILLLEAYTAYLVMRALTKIRIAPSPFTMDVAKILEKVSYVILFTWVVVVLSNAHMKWISKQIAGLSENQFSGDFLFQAAIVFVIAQVFKKGVELQTENDLTV